MSASDRVGWVLMVGDGADLEGHAAALELDGWRVTQVNEAGLTDALRKGPAWSAVILVVAVAEPLLEKVRMLVDGPVPVLVIGCSPHPGAERGALEGGASDWMPGQVSAGVLRVRLQRHVAAAEELQAERQTVVRLTLLSQVDDVTGLHNQRYLFRQLDRELDAARRGSRPLAVLMLDIDRFKEVNDTTDHLFGSAVLRQLARLLQRELGQVAAICRYGGDEFFVVLADCDGPAATAVAERLRAAIAGAEFADASRQVQITVSIGIALFPEHAPTVATELLRLADRAMYAAKAAGRDRIEMAPVGEPAPTLVTQ